MRSKDIDINKFKSIIEVYNFLDNHAFELERNWDTSDIWVKYRNSASSEEEKQMAQWEIDCHLFDVKGPMVFSQVYGNSKDTSEIVGFPSLSKLQKEVIDYVKGRAESTLNPLFKAKYYHFLWCTPKGIKNNKFALFSIENYILAIKEYCEQLTATKDKEASYQIGKLFESLSVISNQVKNDLRPLKDLTKQMLFKQEALEFYAKHGILEDMLKYPKLFKAADFEGALDLFSDQINDKNDKKDDFLLVNVHLPTALKIASKIKADVKKWQNEIGLAYLRMAASETEEERFWIKQEYHANAIIAFGLSGNKSRKAETEKLYADLKPKVKLSTTRIRYDDETQRKLKSSHEKIKTLGKSILTLPPEEVYQTISSGYFFPKYSDIKKASEDRENAFLNFITTIRFDKNQNITIQKDDNFSTESALLDSYSYQVTMSLLPFLHFILVQGIKSGHLTFENLIRHLATNSWIGKPHIKYDLGGQAYNINWISLITPSIVEFFLQIQAWVSTKYYKPNFVLCVDSLTLKIEGLLRDFCIRLNIPTSTNGPKGMQEIYLHNVLDNEHFKNYFNEDDILFFKYLFSNEGGLNLRNNVAHCFFDQDDYHVDQMFLLIAALLRLAKYDMKVKTD